LIKKKEKSNSEGKNRMYKKLNFITIISTIGIGLFLTEAQGMQPEEPEYKPPSPRPITPPSPEGPRIEAPYDGPDFTRPNPFEDNPPHDHLTPGGKGAADCNIS
jgi:hypothetical protein